RAPGRRHSRRRRVHPVRIRGGGGEPAYQSRARSVRENPRIQVLRRQGRAGGRRSAGGGGVNVVPTARSEMRVVSRGGENPGFRCVPSGRGGSPSVTSLASTQRWRRAARAYSIATIPAR